MHKARCKIQKSQPRVEGFGRFGFLHFAFCFALISSACATVPPPLPPEPPVVTWEEKLGWIMRLEDQRILRDPNPPPPQILAPATRNRPMVVAPPPPSDLIRLLADGEARVRRRAALAIGRVGLSEGVEPLGQLLMDEDPEVRQMAIFALGLIDDPAARPVLLAALKDVDPVIQGRAAEALGALGDRSDAPAVSEMVQSHIKAGALTGIGADDLTYPSAPPVEATRLGIYALVLLGSYEALAAAVLDANGQPVSTWWPVSYALQRLGDSRAVPALVGLLNTPGRYTAAFAARGLGAMKAQTAVGPLRQIVERRNAHPAVVVQAVRALAAIGDADLAPVFVKIVADGDTDVTLRIEALTALRSVVRSEDIDLLLDLLSDTSPSIRGGAMQALARVDPATFLAALSGLDPDRDWTVRAAQAAAFGAVPPEQGTGPLIAMLEDRDLRVVAAAMTALVASKAPGTDRILIERLKADDFVVRAVAANGLAELKVTSAAQPLIDAYREAVNDTAYTARAAILSALATLAPAAARPLLQEALNDREWAVRVRAAELLRQAGATEPTAAQIRPATGGRPLNDVEWQALVSPQFSPHAYIETDRGTIEIELAILDAPRTVANFIALARGGFFNGIAIHRVVAP
jgi:HEAT repeat protein